MSVVPEAAEARVAELEAVLRELAWIGGRPYCIACGQQASFGHFKVCKIALALAGHAAYDALGLSPVATGAGGSPGS